MIFFGTPGFAVPTLVALCRHSRQPVLVVTQPSRPSGRGRRLQEPPVASWAREQGIEVLQPENVRAEDFLRRLQKLDPSLAVVVAFGQIFPRALLELPAHGCINLHASLLPRYRGAAPIQAALIGGERRTGVTTMRMDEGLDTGPILLQEEVDITPDETAGELAERLASRGADLVIRTLEGLEQGVVKPRPQNDADATLARRLRRSDGIIDWSQSATMLYDLLRGVTPWPGLSTTLRGQPLKVLWGRPVAMDVAADVPPGSFLGLRQERLVIRCGDATAFGIERLQRPGRKPVSAVDFSHGERLESGELLG